jgi:NAD(P)-dependent dehydrogenase (short-subunit alcohol dehydrogenase family)
LKELDQVEIIGKFALITGAAHRIGKNIALTLAQNGANIIAHYGKSEEKANETVKEISELGVEAIALRANLNDMREIENMFDIIMDKIGQLHILVNNASSFHKIPFKETSLENWENTLTTNLTAPFLCIRKAADLMNQYNTTGKIEAGVIVNIADLSGVYPWEGYSSHGTSKAGLIHLTKVSAKELAPQIRVNAIIPGPILPPANIGQSSEKWMKMIQNLPLQRSGEPKNISDTIVFLVRNNFVTGSIINIDGGESIIGPINH